MNEAWSGFTNVASDEAHVDAQIGYVDGNVTIYSVYENDHPQRKYEVGLNYLKGDMPRRAEGLIREAAMSGHRSSEAAYYWVLATLSDRSFDTSGRTSSRICRPRRRWPWSSRTTRGGGR
ncbi:hypothetical protein [Nonomuraea endophytica]|uniref:hypothetical protein n=1 Tax=Nonomuraea endophytica TaxID=714136 RepID=UPI0037C6B9C0